jgi:hypothetical protein
VIGRLELSYFTTTTGKGWAALRRTLRSET